MLYDSRELLFCTSLHLELGEECYSADSTTQRVRDLYQGRFPLVCSGRPQRTGSGRLKLESFKACAYISPASAFQIPALWPTGAGELNGSDPGAWELVRSI